MILHSRPLCHISGSEELLRGTVKMLCYNYSYHTDFEHLQLYHQLWHKCAYTCIRFLLQDCSASGELSSALSDSCGFEERTSISPVTCLQGSHTRLLLRGYV